MSATSCQLAGTCPGCGWIETPFAEQTRRKVDSLRLAWKNAELGELGEIAIHTPSPFGVRDKVDLIVDGEAKRLGFYDREKIGVLEMASCPQMSQALEAWFQEVKTDLPPIRKGSMRLRVAPDGTRGAWLDFSNVDIKALLDEKAWLERLMAKGIVEAGQRRKRVVKVGEALKLSDPQVFAWMQTRGMPLYTVVGSFTQPGQLVNTHLVDEVIGRVVETGARAWGELGAGCGNFTLPLLKEGVSVTAVEMDPLAVEGLKRAANEMGLLTGLTVVEGQYERWRDLEKIEGLLVDPPRSGLGRFLDGWSATDRKPSDFVYVSCSQESFIDDAKKLTRLGYRLRKISGVDLFPQTPHVEWIASFVV